MSQRREDLIIDLEFRKSAVSMDKRRRFDAVIQHLQGYRLAEIAKKVGAHRDSVWRWIQRYEKGGAEALGDAPRSGRPSKSAEGKVAKARKSETTVPDLSNVDGSTLISHTYRPATFRSSQELLDEKGFFWCVQCIPIGSFVGANAPDPKQSIVTRPKHHDLLCALLYDSSAPAASYVKTMVTTKSLKDVLAGFIDSLPPTNALPVGKVPVVVPDDDRFKGALGDHCSQPATAQIYFEPRFTSGSDMLPFQRMRALMRYVSYLKRQYAFPSFSKRPGQHIPAMVEAIFNKHTEELI